MEPSRARRRDRPGQPADPPWWRTALVYVGALVLTMLLVYWAAGGHRVG